MLIFIGLLLIAALWIWGINLIFQRKEIFGLIGEYLRHNLSKWLIKPTIGCPPCMSSIHGTLVFFAFYRHPNFLLWPVFLICLVGLNIIIKEFIYDTTD